MKRSVSWLVRVLRPLVGFAPGGDRMTAAGGLALAAAVGVVDRVHGDAAHVRAEAHVADPAGLAEVLVHVVGVRHRADGGHAAVQHHAQLARAEADLGIAGVAADQLGVGAGGAGHLGALLRLHLHIVDDGADGHPAKRHGVAGLHVHLLAGDHFVAGLQALGGQDVVQLAVGVLHQGDEGGPVGVVLQPLDGSRHVPLAALEVHDAVEPLGPAAAEAHGHPAVAAAAAGLGQAFDQRLLGATLVEFAAVDQHQAALAGGDRVVVLERHELSAPTGRS